MEMPWHNLFSDMEMEDDGEFFNQQRHSNVNSSFHDEALVLGDIMQLQFSAFSSETETPSPQNRYNNSSAIISAAAEGGSSTLSFDENNNKKRNNNNNKRCKILSKSNSSKSIASQRVPLEKLPAAEASPKSYILSFDDSNVVVGGGGGGRKHQGGGRGRCNCNQSSHHQSGAKKARNSSESLDHIMAERKRRQELTERFIALSATIPGLKKIDKASILSEAINYVKQLQERVKKLEDESSSKKKKVESVSTFINNKADFNNSTEEGTASSKSNSCSSSEECHRSLNNNDVVSLPEVEARALEKQVLVRIHCKKQSGVMLKILTHLKSLDLSLTSNSVLPFGNSALHITIIAQMGDKYKATLKDIVKSMRMKLLVDSPDDISNNSGP